MLGVECAVRLGARSDIAPLRARLHLLRADACPTLLNFSHPQSGWEGMNTPIRANTDNVSLGTPTTGVPGIGYFICWAATQTAVPVPVGTARLLGPAQGLEVEIKIGELLLIELTGYLLTEWDHIAIR